MRSVRRVTAACAAALPLAIGLTGCASTQRIATRARLVAARTRASEVPTRVRRADPAVSAATPAVIYGRGAAAIVVSLRNNSSRALTDLPISVGVRARHGRTVLLNASASADYFTSHVASVAPHAATSWVLITTRRLPSGRPFAIVGYPALSAPAPVPLPRIEASARAAPTARGVSVSIVNRSAIPQYDLPLYVLAVRDGRYVAAGQAAVAHIGTDGTTTTNVAVVGDLRRATLQAIALPTIFS